MSLSNFTVPFAAAVQAPFLPASTPHSAFNGASAINSLLYSSHRDARLQPLAPSRRTPTVPQNDPYAGQYQSQQRYPRNYQEDSYTSNPSTAQSGEYPTKPAGYTKIETSEYTQGGRTSLHAVVDYDDEFDDYYEDEEEEVPELPSEFKRAKLPPVTPIQGPIFVKNGSVPVVPLFSYPVTNNGTLVQIPVSRASHITILACIPSQGRR